MAEPSVINLPVGRVKKIMRSDTDVNHVSLEAAAVMTKATELILERLIESAYSFTRSERKKTIQTTHLSSAVQSADELDFLVDVLAPEPPKKRAPKKKSKEDDGEEDEEEVVDAVEGEDEANDETNDVDDE